MTRACTFRPAAEEDLEGIADYIAQDSPARAVTFVSELRTRCELLAFPYTARLRPEFGVGVRVAVRGKYLVLITVRDDAVIIERIIHGARERRGDALSRR